MALLYLTTAPENRKSCTENFSIISAANLPICLGELGVLPHVIETTLNHVSGHKAGVAGVYNRSKMSDAVRDALQRWADHLDQITAA
jgi:hypothetical protein